MKGFVAAAAMLVACSACSSGPDEYSGLGKWKFGTTVRGDIKEGRCDPTKLSDGRDATWCYALPPFKIGSRVAEPDLYFAGLDATAPLIEIQLHVRGCNDDELVGWMRTNFGAQIDEKPKRYYWQNPHLWAAAFVPSEPGRCEVHFLPLTEAAEIARIKGL